MNRISVLFGPFNEDEIQYYINRLEDNGSDTIINGFQKNLIFNLFYKYFGDPVSINSINKIDYVKLMMAASKELLINNMKVLPYIISSRVKRLQGKKTISKREMARLEASPTFQQIRQKYKSEKIEKQILSIIATILSSEFVIIDYYDEDLDGKEIECPPDVIVEEVCMYINLI